MSDFEVEYVEADLVARPEALSAVWAEKVEFCRRCGSSVHTTGRGHYYE
ncbi:hypothetical protein [Streptomyces sp. NRRL S-448]